MQEQDLSKATLTFIGGGNMASSLIGGLLEKGYPATAITVCDPIPAAREQLSARFGIHSTVDNLAAVQTAQVVVLAVKPQIMQSVARTLQPALTHNPLVISIAAGIDIETLQGWLGPQVPIVRCMPNTPALVQTGATGLYATALVSAPQRQLADAILGAVGCVCWLQSEQEIDVVTALSGSGPAYFFLVMEAVTRAGIDLGLNPDVARQLTLQTALGSARMALASDVDSAELRRRVTSPGGTTERAIAHLQNGGLETLFADAITAAYRRAQEMAEEAKN